MALHRPILRRYVPPTPEVVEQSRAEIDQARRERAVQREGERPAREAVLRTGPPLRDVAAAVDCWCGCHPRPAQADLHDGGATCSCQLTADERAERWSNLAASSAVWREDSEYVRQAEERRAHFEAAATSLGVAARIEAEAAPFVIVGTCDGRGFYLRERHGEYRVTIAPDDDPESNPWAADYTVSSIDIASGDEIELYDGDGFSPTVALDLAVRAVRTTVARGDCGHVEVDDAPYCPRCGVLLAEAEAWRRGGS